MMNDLNCSKIISESSSVLSWNDDIHLMHYTQKEEKIKANMCVHMNLINIVLNGKKEIIGSDGKTVVPAGSGFFMKKGSYLVTDKIEDAEKGYEALIIFFSDAWLRTQASSILACSGNAQASNYNTQSQDMALLPGEDLMIMLSAQLSSFFGLNANQERLQSFLPAKIRELLQVLISGPGGKDLEVLLRSLDASANPALEVLMQKHYKENISLEQYAFLANCSLSTFKRRFNQTFNMNPGKWIMQRRLEEAYELLKSEKNITQIAYEVGFETPAHFIASFKQKYRNTPKQLQQRM